MAQLGFYIDVERCTGCKTCMAACRDKKNSPQGVKLRRVTEFSGGDWKKQKDGSWKSDVFAYYTSISCNHCSDPACVKVCPTKAHYKRESDGLVLIDQSKCIGCGACARACPYGAPQLNTQIRKMSKCDACADRLAEGLNPICVDACPQRAIEFGDISELRKKYGSLAAVAPMPEADITKPNLVIHASKNCKKIGEVGQIH